MTAREADEVLVSADASKTGRVFITVVHGRYETALNVSAGELVRLRAAIDAHLSTPPADDVREALATVVAITWRDTFGTPTDVEFADAVLAAFEVRPHGAVTDAEVDAAAKAMFEDGIELPGDYTWAQMVAEDPSRADIWRADARRVLEAAREARS